MKWKWKLKGANGHGNDSNNDSSKKPTATVKFFPLSGQRLVHRRTRPMQLRTVAGVIELEVLHGQDPTDAHWGCPMREHWGLSQHQQLSLALEDKLAFTLTATTSYEEAAAVAQKWGTAVTDSALHALAQRLGARAEARPQQQTGPWNRHAQVRQLGRKHQRPVQPAPGDQRGSRQPPDGQRDVPRPSRRS